MKKIVSALGITLSILLAGCSTTTAPMSAVGDNTVAMSWPQRQQQLQQLTAWQLQGAIGITQAKQRWSASVNWQQQNANNYALRLFGPFGAGAVQLTGNANQVILRSSSQPQPLTASSPEALIQQQTGWDLPVSNLYYWVRGLPIPAAAITQQQFDAAHRLIELQQAGWDVQYISYANIQGIDLPYKIVLSNNNFNIKLVIKQWQFRV
jgi:outer membrane lipoprotein LolB